MNTADHVDTPTRQRAVTTEQTIATLRYEWEVLVAVVRRLLAAPGDQ